MKDAPNALTCKHCINSRLRPSSTRGWRDRVMGLFGKRPMRCHACGKRFYVAAGLQPDTTESVSK